jgi:sigma-B regulation protein RsbU (phosphoserine phosphatase)
MIDKNGITVKLVFLILTSIILIFALIFGYNYFYSRKIITDRIEKEAKNLARATVNRIDAVLLAVQKVPYNLAITLTQPAFGNDITSLLCAVVADNPEIYGATIAFEPHAYKTDLERYAPYCYKVKGKTELTQIPYDYSKEDWYQIPKALGHPVWSEPYFDEGAGNIVMTTYSVPFYRTISGRRELTGIVTADISLEWLKKIVASIKIAESGYGFLLTKNGTFVTHPQSELVMNETIFSVAESLEDPRMREIGRDMIKGKSGFVPFKSLYTGKDCWMVYTTLSSSGWSLGVLFPQAELMADVARLNRMVFIIFLAGMGIICGVIILIARSITRPLRLLSGATSHIATGNLDIDLPAIKSKDEVGRLAEAFKYMISSLKKYIEELTAATAARERIEGELQVARDIQMGILPKTFPPFPERKEFDVFALLKPAKEVGGDLFDFFFLDDDHLCFTIGDVSGKGVPASLFMAVTRTMIKTKATVGLTPAKVLTNVNRDLSMDNPSLMFVTLFLGVLNVRTGELQYVNAGHESPYLLTPDGRLGQLTQTRGVLLGVEEDFFFDSKETMIEPGATLLLFTDGVTEAINTREEVFSNKRLEQVILELRDKSVEEMATGILEAVETFSKGVSQFDDITLMALHYNGR